MSQTPKPIGGYFELEIRKDGNPHQGALKLNTARNCFEYVLRARQLAKVHIPYYTCEVMLEPIRKLGIECEFYSVNELMEPVSLPKLEAQEAFLYTNYYGVKQECVKRLAGVLGRGLIVDNAQAFYSLPQQGIDTFYSPRKYFGVPDGAFLYTDAELGQFFTQDVSSSRMSHLLKRIEAGAEAGYEDFKNNDASLCNQDIKWMSKLTEVFLSGIDYQTAKQTRRKNYAFLENTLQDSNQIHLTLEDDAVPMVYPFLTNDSSLRQRLIDNKIFVATYWPNVKRWVNPGTVEYELADKLIPLPIDQRYGREEMERILQIILG